MNDSFNMRFDLTSSFDVRALDSLDRPFNCQIMVRGSLGNGWEQYFDMQVSYEITANGVPLSILTGCLVDQAALMGVLNNLYGFGLTLLYVSCTPSTTGSVHSGEDTTP